jgi:hypothetical protein
MRRLSNGMADGGCMLPVKPPDSDLRNFTVRRCRPKHCFLKLVRDAHAQLIPLTGRNQSRGWDGNGGRHGPSYAKGWDPSKGDWVERIYYSGGRSSVGPYDQPKPAFVPQADWEHGSVYEPNLIYHHGRWKMWYVAGSNQ